MNAQEISAFSAPVSRSTSCQIMLLVLVWRLISGIRSSHSRPSRVIVSPVTVFALDQQPTAGTESDGTSFIPHFGQASLLGVP